MYENNYSDYLDNNDNETTDITIDVDSIKRDLLEECYGAAFGGGFGGGLVESFDIERMSAEEIVQLAVNKGYDINRYVI